jgi:hypothetical protein
MFPKLLKKIITKLERHLVALSLFFSKESKNAQNALGFEHSQTPSNKVFASCFTMNKNQAWGTPLS